MNLELTIGGAKFKMEKTGFRIKMHHRHDLRSWLEENFPFLRKSLNYSQEDISKAAERAFEIVEACRVVEEIDLRARSAYVNYYKQDWQKIKKSYEERNYEAMCNALNILLGAIDVE